MLSCNSSINVSWRRLVVIVPSRSRFASDRTITASNLRRLSPQAEMLHTAANRHAQAANAEKLESSQDAEGPSRSRFSSQYPSSATNALKTINSSGVNALSTKRFIPPQQGVKRSMDGLAKVVSGSFDDDLKNGKITYNNGKTGEIETIDIDENDFESDVDLDVEPAKSAISYPAIHKVPASGQREDTKIGSGKPQRMPSPIIYPSLPRQQAVQTHNHDFGMDPSSSAPIEWSSSPVAHKQPKLSSYSFEGIKSESKENDPLKKAAGPRKLPWNEKEGTFVKPEPTSTYRTAATPASKTAKKATELWNSTASAVKEQQKKHREEARKIVKKETVKKEVTAEEPNLVLKVTKKRVPKVFLSEEQQRVLNIVVEDKDSVFFTGSAGTGKSVLLREIIAALKKKYHKETDRVAVTASTGLAACNIGGTTLHSFSGIGLGKEDVTELVKKVKRNAKARHRWLRTRVLLIDEVSMVDGELFDKLESVARQVRNNGRPWGGIQLVCCGDFFQLPPVPEHNRAAKFAFDASTWPTVIKHTIGLRTVFRQKDPVFAGMLNEMREGRLSPASIEAFKNLDREISYQDEVGATELFPLRIEVERANAGRLTRLEGDLFTFEARDGGSIQDKVARDRLLSNCMAPETITLKKGAQVMLIKNIDESLVNGSIGIVVAFMDEANFDRYSADEDLYAQMDDGTLASQAAPESKEEQARRRLTDNLTTARRFPLVRFTLADGTSRDMLCQPETWKVEQSNGEVQASRSQIPLILAWALSIHKAQGQTLTRVKVDLSRAFEKGQAYVALSRATSMQGLQVKGFHPSKIMAHEKVVKFYNNLAKADSIDTKKVEVKPQKVASEYERRFQEDASNF